MRTGFFIQSRECAAFKIVIQLLVFGEKRTRGVGCPSGLTDDPGRESQDGRETPSPRMPWPKGKEAKKARKAAAAAGRG